MSKTPRRLFNIYHFHVQFKSFEVLRVTLQFCFMAKPLFRYKLSFHFDRFLGLSCYKELTHRVGEINPLCVWWSDLLSLNILHTMQIQCELLKKQIRYNINSNSMSNVNLKTFFVQHDLISFFIPSKKHIFLNPFLFFSWSVSLWYKNLKIINCYENKWLTRSFSTVGVVLRSLFQCH